MKKYKVFVLLLAFMLLISCDRVSETETRTAATETLSVETTIDPSVSEVAELQNNDELLELIIKAWSAGRAADLYRYAASDITELMNREAFAYLFESVSDIGGVFLNRVDKGKKNGDGVEVYSLLLEFENVEAEVQISIKDRQICGFVRNIYFKKSFEIERENNIVERYFVLNSDGYELNAVYTYVNDGARHPAVILISGSGPIDYNSTVGILTPFEDLARGLADDGINSIRFDKRTFNYASELSKNMGVEEEYFRDCIRALEYVKEQNAIGDIYFFGHSLGGQIAAELARRNDDAAGIVLLNSSARHLADIVYDQYVAVDSQNKTVYAKHSALARECKKESAKGNYYYGATDYYWASYNELDTISSIMNADIPALIMNSTYDGQTFGADLALWEDAFVNYESVILKIYDDINHFGYKFDPTDVAALYKRAKFPVELIETIVHFIDPM